MFHFLFNADDLSTRAPKAGDASRRLAALKDWLVRERRWLAALAAWTLGLVWAYWPALCDMQQRWSNDPRYSHGYLVPGFAALVLWSRRQQLGRLRPRASWWGLPLVLLGTAIHLAGGYVFFHWLDAVSLLPTLAGVCLLLGGGAALRWCWPAVAFLLFMMPLPYQLEVALAHPLQRLATAMSTYALQTVGLPAVAEGNIIWIEELQIGVLEACSGLGMLMTFLALSTAVAFLIHRPWRDKLVVLVSSIPIAVLMNVVRITVTGVLFVVAGPEIARMLFHDMAGWLMMPLALACLWLELIFLDRLFLKPEPTGPVPVFLGPAANRGLQMADGRLQKETKPSAICHLPSQIH